MVFKEVAVLSDDDCEPACSSRDIAQPRKRRRKQSAEPDFRGLTDDDMKKRLCSECPCKKSCLKQFAEEPLFTGFKAYLTEWMSLSKLDKDNIVPCFNVQLFSFFDL